MYRGGGRSVVSRHRGGVPPADGYCGRRPEDLRDRRLFRRRHRHVSGHDAGRSRFAGDDGRHQCRNAEGGRAAADAGDDPARPVAGCRPFDRPAAGGAGCRLRAGPWDRLHAVAAGRRGGNSGATLVRRGIRHRRHSSAKSTIRVPMPLSVMAKAARSTPGCGSKAAATTGYAKCCSPATSSLCRRVW